MPDIKLIALDDEDLSVISAHLQDAVLHVGDMAYIAADRRFVLVANRFDWGDAQLGGSRDKHASFKRRRSGLRIDRVLGAQVSDLDLTEKDQVLSLLAVSFESSEDPSGHIILTFAGGPAIRLEVECVEVMLEDLGAAWETGHKPEHPDDRG